MGIDVEFLYTSIPYIWAPAYACMHLGWWEEEVFFRSLMYISHIALWLRFIDDALVLWQGSDVDHSYTLQIWQFIKL